MSPRPRPKNGGPPPARKQPVDHAASRTPGPSRPKPHLPPGAPVVLALAIAFVGSGPSAGLLAYRLCTDGVIAVAWLAAAVALGWGVARHLPVPRLLRWVTAAALGLGAVSLAVLLLGLAGWLNAITVWGILGAGWGLGALWLLRHFGITRAPTPFDDAPPAAAAGPAPPNPWRHLVWLAMPFFGLVITAATVPPGPLWQDEPAGYDVSEYHLQVPREWYQAGRIAPLTHNVFSYMPMNVEAHDLLAMHLRGGPWAGMYLAQFMHVGWMALAVLAAAGIASALSDAPWAAPLAGVTVTVVPWTTLLAPIAYNEAGLLLFGTLAIGWALVARDARGWLIAGLFAGLACGVKLTAAPMVVIAIVVAALALRLRSPRPTPMEPVPWVAPTIQSLALFLAASAITFAPWLVRNQVWAHNPVFPEAMETLGKAHFSDVQVERWRRAHSPTPDQQPVAQRFVAAATQIGFDWRYGFLLLPAGAAALALRRDRAAAFLALILALQLVVWLAFTHLQGRFYILAVPIAAIAVGSVRRPRWPTVGTGLAIAIAAVSLFVQVPRYNKFVWQVAQSTALGIEDLSWLVTARTNTDLETVPTDKPLILAGDAEAFSYSGVPMSRLRYRTVFDVPPAKNGDWLAAWTGTESGTVIVTPADLRRFKLTYFDVPTPTTEELDSHPAPYVIKR